MTIVYNPVMYFNRIRQKDEEKSCVFTNKLNFICCSKINLEVNCAKLFLKTLIYYQSIGQHCQIAIFKSFKSGIVLLRN